MNPSERQALLILASVYSLRMLGLFMILPVFAIYATKLTGSTPFGIGVALGIYGLTQAIFQVPFGYISDRLGRKPLIIIGLLLLALGSVVAALSHSLVGVILGRGIQGMGATGGVIMALLADLTREETRLRAMACIGLCIGFSFALAFILGPLLNIWVGVQGIFGITAIFSLAAVGIVIWFLPNVTVIRSDTSLQLASQQVQPKHPEQPLLTSRWLSTNWHHLRKTGLLPLYLGILILHASLTAIFLKIPQAVENFQFEQGETWKFYFLILLASCVLTIPIILWMERAKKFKPIMSLMIMLLAFSELGISIFFHSLLGLSLCMTLFFTAFNVLEASLPSLISKRVESHSKGTALGIFSALQFLGLFLGGFLGGLLDSLGGLVAVIVFCVILALIWFVWNIKGLNLWHEA